ncbi:unnamed protein product [Prorocentrum cordatum]|uniref:Peptidase A1 domain-containing protein n=1 Tax=Prorocentrum cordatum TaxID=2364126 RepID=A0ABN9PIJ6_9DINO|nr:unnamed protein product [Polarella glacialis]
MCIHVRHLPVQVSFQHLVVLPSSTQYRPLLSPLPSSHPHDDPVPRFEPRPPLSILPWLGAATEVPVVGTHTWSVELKNVRIRGSLDKGSSKNAVKEIGCGDGCSAIIDSGTSLLAVPGFIIEQLQDMMEQLDTDCSNLHELPSLVFNMGDGQFTLPPDSYVAEVVGQLPNYLEGYTTMETEHNSSESMSEADPADGVGKRGSRSRCQLLLMESYASTKYGPLWILGIPFFRRYYTTFRIGESHKDRTLFMAPSTDDCYVEGQEDGQASFLDVGSRDTYLRTINASFIHAPVLAQRAIQSGFMHL